MRGNKRLFLAAGSIASVGAVVALAVGVTFGLFSAQQVSGSNGFTAGTVTENAPSISNCTVAHIVPGDSGDCTLSVKYTGSEPADLAIDVAVAGTSGGVAVTGYGCSAATPSAGLFDDSSNGLQIGLTDVYPSPTITYNLSGLSGATSSTTNLLTARNVAQNTTETYDLHWSMANNGCADDNYQGASSTFTFNVHAVQAAHQPADSTTAGSQDSTLTWS